MGLRWQEDAGRSDLGLPSRKVGQRGWTRLCSCQCVTTALLPPEAGWMSTYLYSPESTSLRKQEEKQCSDPLALVGEAKARQRPARFPAVRGVILPPHALGAPAPASCAYPVEGCADASAHSVQGTGTGVPEGRHRCCALGSLAPRQESAPTVRRTGLCWSVSSPGHPYSSASPGEAHLFLLLPVGQAPLCILRARTAPVTESESESVGWLRSDLLQLFHLLEEAKRVERFGDGTQLLLLRNGQHLGE
jgi:hypothetical protein